MMKAIDRRGALGLFGTALGAQGIVGSAVAQSVAQAETKTAAPPAANVEPASYVNGDYRAVYQEGYAQALLTLGFSDEFLLQMFSKVTERLAVFATAKTLFLRPKPGAGERQISLGTPVQVELFGAQIPDWLARFDQPNRLVTSFTGPSGKRVGAIQTFHADGFVTVLSVDGEPQSKPVRVWRRMAKNEQTRRRLPQLFPL